jgi:hypothetical protein
VLRIIGMSLSGIVLLVNVACAAAEPITPALPASGIVLQQILADCWGVTQLKELDGTRPEHTRGFECARPRLLQMARTYPDAAESHRLLAWGYYFALQDEDAARAEYERAAQIYEKNAHPTEQSEMLVQIASIALKYDFTRGCTLLTRALSLDTTNARASQLLHNFGCPELPPATPSATSG